VGRYVAFLHATVHPGRGSFAYFRKARAGAAGLRCWVFRPPDPAVGRASSPECLEARAGV